jgi:voltage-gated potassium channel
MTKVERWERNAEIPLLLLAVAFLAAYAVLVVDQGLTPHVREALITVSWAVWGAFAFDFLARLFLAEQRALYARHHWYDVALIALPVLRPLRLLRLFALARILNRSAAGSLVGQVTTYAAGVAVMSIGLGSLAILDAERAAKHANITTLRDALWWAATTVTTVGYGDRYPVTTEGRLIAVALMVVGIGLVGAVTASVAAWMVRQVDLKSVDHGQ